MLIQVSSTQLRIVPEPTDEVAKLLDDRFSFKHPGAFFIKKSHKERVHPVPVPGCYMCGWNGRVSFYKRNTLAAGFLSDLIALLDEHGVLYEIKDNRVIPPRQFDWNTSFVLRTYQQETVDAILSRRQGIVEAACGAGKTIMAVEAIAQVGVPAIIVVPTKIILSQFEAAIKNNSDIPLGIIQGKTWEEEPVVVATMGALSHKSKRARAKDFLATRDFIVVDEYQKSAAKTWFEMINHCPAYYRIGQTATPFRGSELEDQYLYANTGPIIASVKTDELQDSGYLAQADVRFIRCGLNPPRLIFGEYTDEDGEKQVGNHKPHWTDLYRECIVRNEERNNMVADIANHYVTQGQKVLIIVSWTEQFEQIEQYLRDTTPIFLSGKDSRSVSEKKINEFAEQSSGIIVGSPVLDLGCDIPALEVVINSAAGEAEGRTQQRMGRGLRLSPNKTDVRIYDFLDNDTHTKGKHYFSKHAHARVKTFEGLGQTVTIYDTVQEALEANNGWRRMQYGVDASIQN